MGWYITFDNSKMILVTYWPKHVLSVKYYPFLSPHLGHAIMKLAKV
jgi:hypothetical protein